MVSRNSLIAIIKILIFIILIEDIIGRKFHQTDYSFVFERCNVLFVNKNYVDKLNVSQRFASRYEKKYSVGLYLLQDLDAHKLTLYVEGRKFQSNEYRLFPFNYTENCCVAIKIPSFGVDYQGYNCSFKLSCNIKKGFYSCSDIYFDDSEFPPFAPRGRFKLTMRLIYNESILLGANEYFIEIKPRNPLERTIGV